MRAIYTKSLTKRFVRYIKNSKKKNGKFHEAETDDLRVLREKKS